MILFINACVRSMSRTKELADRYLSGCTDTVYEERLEDIDFPKVDEAFLRKRDRLIGLGKFDDPMFDLAVRFAEADRIVIAAPCWDLSFPSSLKQYLEQICVIGLTFRYTSDGIPEGLCRASDLTYITTVGGDFFPSEYGFGYVCALSKNFYGINRIKLIKATGLDTEGADVEKILRSAEEVMI